LFPYLLAYLLQHENTALIAPPWAARTSRQTLVYISPNIDLL